MSRMLEALKRLESQTPTATRATPGAAQVVVVEQPGPASGDQPPATALSPSEDATTPPTDSLVQEVESLVQDELQVPKETPAQVETPPSEQTTNQQPLPLDEQQRDEAADDPCSDSPVKQTASDEAELANAIVQETEAERPAPTDFENKVSRELERPGRSRELCQIADRLTEALPQDLATSIMLVPASPSSEWPDILAQIGTVLADRGGGRVLLLDADLEERSLTRCCEHTDKPGVAEVLNDQADWQSVVVPLGERGIGLLPAGTASLASYRVAGRRFAALLASLEAHYQYVMVSAAAATNPWTQEVGRTCRAAYLLVELGATESTAATEAARQLQASGTRLLGCIATGAANC